MIEEFVDIDTRPKTTSQPDKKRKPKHVVGDQGQKADDAAPGRLIKRRASARKPNYLTPGDALWNIVGMDKSEDGPTDVSSNKNDYLSKAYLHERD